MSQETGNHDDDDDASPRLKHTHEKVAPGEGLTLVWSPH